MLLDQAWFAQRCYMFSQVAGIVLEDNRCPICIEEMAATDEVLLLECRHIYHKACGLQWFEDKQECPMCRQKQENLRHLIAQGRWGL
jgi:hypothetical protein